MSLVPANMNVDKRVEEIKGALLNISEWCNVYLHERMETMLQEQRTMNVALREQLDEHRITQDKVNAAKAQFEIMHQSLKEEHEKTQQKVNAIKVELKGNVTTSLNVISIRCSDLQPEYEDKQAESVDQDVLERLRASLQVSPDDSHTNVPQCCDAIRRTFELPSNTTPARKHFSKMTLDRLASEDVFAAWTSDSVRTLLLLGGLTVPQSRRGQSAYSWLSLAATEMIRAKQQDQKPAAFYTCHPNHFHDPESKPTLQSIVANIVFQIASHNPSILRDKSLKHFDSALLHSWHESRHDRRPMTLFAQQVLRAASAQQEQWVIIDRLDFCSRPPDTILTTLREMLDFEGCRIKILTTWDTVNSDIAEECSAFLERNSATSTGRFDLDQRSGDVFRPILEHANTA